MHPSRSPSLPCPTAFHVPPAAELTPTTENASGGILGGLRACPVCQREFKAKRPGAITCSAACRTRKSREGRRASLDIRVRMAEVALIAANSALAELRGYVLGRLGPQSFDLGSRDGA